MTEILYLDANVFVYANLDASGKGERARSLLEKVQSGHQEAVSSALTFDELTWAVKRNRSLEDAVAAGEAFLHMPGLKILRVDAELLVSALDLIKSHKLDPRDSIHATSALREGAKTIVSADVHFDRLKELKRRDI